MDVEDLLTKYERLIEDSTVQGAAHVRDMIGTLQYMLTVVYLHPSGTPEREDFIGKFNRWAAFVQGWMWSRDLRAVDQLRDETRGIDAALRAL